MGHRGTERPNLLPSLEHNHMKKLIISPILRSLRDMKDGQVSAVQDWIEETLYEITRIPRNVRYWFLKTFTITKIKVPELHGAYHDTDTLMLYTNFQLLVTYMEVEVSHMWDICLADHEPAKHLKPRTNKEKAEA